MEFSYKDVIAKRLYKAMQDTNKSVNDIVAIMNKSESSFKISQARLLKILRAEVNITLSEAIILGDYYMTRNNKEQ